MGMMDAFDRNADFSNIAGDKSLFIDTVLHKAVIEMDEEGTKAAASTAITMAFKCSGFDFVPVLRFDHPFNFYIFDEKKDIILFNGLFVGK